MARIIEIEKKLSMMEENHRHILYLITEDRDIVESVFEEAADTLKGFLGENTVGRASSVFQSVSDKMFYQVAVNNRIITDAYETFGLGEKNYIPEGLFGERHEMFSDKKGGLSPRPVFFLLRDFQILKEQTAAHFLKQFLLCAKQEEEENKRFVLLFIVSPFLKIPQGFDTELEIVDVPEMDENDIRRLLEKQLQREYKRCPKMAYEAAINLTGNDDVDMLRIREAAKDFKGISRKGIEEILTDLYMEFGSFVGRAKDATGKEENFREIRKARRCLIAEFKKREAGYDKTVTILEAGNEVEGLGEFKNWIQDIKDDLLHPEEAYSYGNEPPKGVLLTGIPGSGKTQAAKWVAYEMGGASNQVPLIQFRMDNLLGGLVGDSEANFRRCRKRIEALAPCVVLMDELEKTFEMNSQKGNNDVKMNILTALLDWMQENKKPIFFFATSNSVSGLRPELLRDGRFDMRFSVFMPTFQELVKIFSFHMRRANERAGGLLFVHSIDYEETASVFLEKITQYAIKNKKYMFYTGANAENLVTQANRRLRKNQTSRPYRQSDYINALLESAKGKYSQPYGETNMSDIAEFWLRAYENKYANAGSLDLFPFSDYEKKECRFNQTAGQTEKLCAYDAYMYQCISEEITSLDKIRKGLN